jgi:arsenate reductase-like glutaredoxin family protein
MKKNLPAFFKFLFCLLFILAAEFYLVRQFACPKLDESASDNQEVETTKPKGMMILIEYTDMVGLSNFVNEMYKRDVTGVFFTGPDFVEENCEEVKKLLEYNNIEIMGAYVKDPLWDMSYEEQYDALKDTKERIEACTGEPIRILSSKYQASDENTAKAAEALGVPYIVARGTTETEAFVYQPEEYDVKILSVSNIPSIRFKYGSLCDYSYWVRGGSPEDMMTELEAAKYNNKVTPVSHTKIGGIKERWLDMWVEYWDTFDIEWVGLDEIMTVDMTLPYWQIPQNHNNPYTPSTMQPDFELTEEEDVKNPCAVDDLPFVQTSENSESLENSELVIFSNGTGSMCIEAEEYFDENGVEYTLHLTTEEDFNGKLEEYRSGHSSSEGVSNSFGYYPFIFIEGKAYSGFNEEIGEEIMDLLDS